MNSNVDVKAVEINAKLSHLFSVYKGVLTAFFELTSEIDEMMKEVAVKKVVSATPSKVTLERDDLGRFLPRGEWCSVTDPNFNRGFRGRPRSKTTRLLLTLKRNDTTFIPYPGKTRRSAKNIRLVSNAAKYVTKLTGARFSRRSMTGGVMITRVA